ncbi:hypothetical protein [uncultured Aquimarina sp.]|uniref:hypothetical protein n=1 Tax=uncultured Aquimarina sp. TaxID=575652 RepID=UPI002611AF6D|nr:hypothetical protein [uncultured Aquimarina sp.]
MKYSFIICTLLLLCSNLISGQFLTEQDWATLSKHIKTKDKTSFESFIKQKEFIKSEESNQKYTFYQWEETKDIFYGIRVNKKSGQVTYMTNDQNYVLKLLSRFVSEYSLIESKNKGTTSITHVFKSQTSTIAIKLDTASDSGTHLLFAVNK